MSSPYTSPRLPSLLTDREFSVYPCVWPPNVGGTEETKPELMVDESKNDDEKKDEDEKEEEGGPTPTESPGASTAVIQADLVKSHPFLSLL